MVGVSTLVAARCCQLNGHGHVYSLEHDADFAERTCQHLQRHGLQDWATVILAPLMQGGDGEKWYDDARLPSKLAAIDMLVIDGPPGGGDSTARYPAFPRLRNRLSPNAVIVLDDADRPGERAIVNRWIQLEPNLRRTYLPAEKGLVFLKLEEKCVA